jgi:hypothetical protein
MNWGVQESESTQAAVSAALIPKRDNVHDSRTTRDGEGSKNAPSRERHEIPRAAETPFASERRLSAKSHVDPVLTPVVQERHEERAFGDPDSVYFCEDDAPTDAVRVLDGNRVSRGSIFHRRLVVAPTLGNARVD